MERQMAPVAGFDIQNPPNLEVAKEHIARFLAVLKNPLASGHRGNESFTSLFWRMFQE